MFGFGVAKVNDKLQLIDVDIFYKPETFIQVLRGERKADDLKNGQDIMGPAVAGGCPHFEALSKSK
eukprot:scaffold9047_cov139-Isochrysis_galbana.AAC.1